jgi:hypothetical protein
LSNKLKRVQEKERKKEAQLKLDEELRVGKEIIKGIFLGNSRYYNWSLYFTFRAAQNYDWLVEKNIKSILNVSKEVRNYYEPELKYKR